LNYTDNVFNEIGNPGPAQFFPAFAVAVSAEVDSV